MPLIPGTVSNDPWSERTVVIILGLGTNYTTGTRYHVLQEANEDVGLPRVGRNYGKNRYITGAVLHKLHICCIKLFHTDNESAHQIGKRL